MIVIIDYGMGNLRSVQKALERVGAKAIVSDNPLMIHRAQKVVLPGVGAIQPAMERLQQKGLIGAIRQSVEEKKPFLGICLGLQLLFEKSDEGGNVCGLGILKGCVRRFQEGKIPHMGWNQIAIKNLDSPLFEGIQTNSFVYFCHSYYVEPTEKSTIATITQYSQEFVSAVSISNIFGVQFHPEKSQNVGLKILKNFVEMGE